MQFSTLGRTGLKISKASLGSGGRSRLGQTQGASAAQSVKVIHAALGLGINLIDTAPAYKTEEIVGEALKGRRNDVILSTKVRINGDDRPFDSDELSGRPFHSVHLPPGSCQVAFNAARQIAKGAVSPFS